MNEYNTAIKKIINIVLKLLVEDYKTLNNLSVKNNYILFLL